MKSLNFLLKVFTTTCLFFLSLNYSLASGVDEALIKKCDSCHGVGGVSTSADIPTIAGIPEWNLSDQMFQYLDGRPAKTVNYVIGAANESGDMQTVINELTEEQIEQLAAYYSGFEFVRSKQSFDINMAKIGEDIHKKQCDSCHSKAGSDPEDEASILAGQNKEYILSSLKEYRDGLRASDNKMLREIKKLDGQQLVYLSEYYASIQ